MIAKVSAGKAALSLSQVEAPSDDLPKPIVAQLIALLFLAYTACLQLPLISGEWRLPKLNVNCHFWQSHTDALNLLNRTTL